MEKHTISIVGAETLLGRELRDVVETRKLPYRVHLMGATGISAELGKEDVEDVTLVTPLDELLLTESEATVLASVPELKIWERCPYIVDATGVLPHQPRKLHSLEHPIASVVASFLMTVHRVHAVRGSVIQAFAPASEWGRHAVEEMQKQAVALLSFRKIPQDLFDMQVAFSMAPRYGTEAKLDPAALERRIYSSLTTLLAIAGNPPAPSFRLAPAPIFHGHSLSAWVEFNSAADVKKLANSLIAAHREESPDGFTVTPLRKRSKWRFVVNATIEKEDNIMASLDWSQCPAVESVADRRSGAWVFRDTRMPVATVFENLEDGSSLEEIIEQFHVTREQIQAVLEFAARSLDAPPLSAGSDSVIDAHTL